MLAGALPRSLLGPCELQVSVGQPQSPHPNVPVSPYPRFPMSLSLLTIKICGVAEAWAGVACSTEVGSQVVGGTQVDRLPSGQQQHQVKQAEDIRAGLL